MELKPRPKSIRGYGAFPSADQLNDMAKGLLQQISGSQVRKAGNRVMVAGPTRQPSQGYMPLQDFVVLSVDPGGNLLQCIPLYLCDPAFGLSYPLSYNANLGTDLPAIQQYYVAKPYTLQSTPWQGLTTPIDPTQPINPAYFSGDIIMARFMPTGYTAPGQTDDQGNPVPVVWLDLNTAGRNRNSGSGGCSGFTGTRTLMNMACQPEVIVWTNGCTSSVSP